MNAVKRDEIIALLTCLTGVDMKKGTDLSTYNMPAIKPFGKEVLEELINGGWNINSASEGVSKLLDWICTRDDLHRLNLLFEYGLKLDNKPNIKKTALNTAIANGSCFVAKRLNEYAVYTPSDDIGNSPLHIAVSSNDLALVKALIAKGSDVYARNYYGSRPLHLAAFEANLEIVTYLIDNGAHIDAHDLNGRNALHEACRSSGSNGPVVAKKLIEAGAKTDFLDNDKNTLLHLALISKKFATAIFLIDLFPDINQLNCFNESYIYLAAGFGPKLFLEKLIGAGADVNIKECNGQTALHKALMTNTIEVVEYLLEKGADVNAVSNRKEYPILLALKRTPCLPFVKALVRHGANISVKDQNGLSTLELALESRF